jgi:hypothetical protein
VCQGDNALFLQSDKGTIPSLSGFRFAENSSQELSVTPTGYFMVVEPNFDASNEIITCGLCTRGEIRRQVNELVRSSSFQPAIGFGEKNDRRCGQMQSIGYDELWNGRRNHSLSVSTEFIPHRGNTSFQG